MTVEDTASLAYRLMESWLPLPEGRQGKCEITGEDKHVGDKLTVTSMREALYSGLPQTSITLTKPYHIQALESDDDGVWMTNQPCELVQMWREFSADALGPVLVGGLGLGVVVQQLQYERNIRWVTVVEKDPDVVSLVAPHYQKSRYLKSRFRNHPTILNIDIFEFAKTHHREKPSEYLYRTALLDTWQGTGEYVWQFSVVPLRRLLYGKIQTIKCWQEDVMIGQVWETVCSAVVTDAERQKRRSICHGYTVRKAWEDHCQRHKIKLHTYAPGSLEVVRAALANRFDPDLIRFARTFVYRVGTPTWERRFGKYWDEAVGAGD